MTNDAFITNPGQLYYRVSGYCQVRAQGNHPDISQRVVAMAIEGWGMFWIFVAGFLGGVIRGLIGVSKYIGKTPTKKRKIRKDWLAFTLLSSGGIGLLVGVFIADDIRFALLAGYAGTDFIEGMYKLKMKSRSWG